MSMSFEVKGQRWRTCKISTTVQQAVNYLGTSDVTIMWCYTNCCRWCYYDYF